MNNRSTQSETLASHLLHLSVLKLITRSAPFTHTKTQPLYTLTDLLGDYLSLLATSTKQFSELSGRNEITIWDLGKTLEEFGLGDLNDLKQELLIHTTTSTSSSKDKEINNFDEEGIIIENEIKEEDNDEIEKIRELAGGLREMIEPPPIKEPYIQLSYVPLKEHELIKIQQIELLNEINQTLMETSSIHSLEDSDNLDSDLEPESIPYSPIASSSKLVKLEFDSDFQSSTFTSQKQEEDEEEKEEEEDKNSSSWRDPSLIPSYIQSFLPPFPGMEKEGDISEPVRRKREKERERDLADLLEANNNTSIDSNNGNNNPWINILPLNNSSYNGQSIQYLSQPISISLSSTNSRKNRLRSISPTNLTSTTSIPFYNQVTNEIRHPPTWPRPNPKRRLIASRISVNPDVTLSTDSLFGSIPIPPTHSASLTSGFLPDLAPSRIHPFNTSLPHTIATPAIIHPSPHALLSAPVPYPRIPNIISSITTPLSLPTSDYLPLFTRLTRIGPPGPLGPKGEALEYEFVAGTGIVAMNIEWPQRLHNAKLPKGIRERERRINIEDEINGVSSGGDNNDYTSSVGGGGTGIRLSLGGGGVRAHSRSNSVGGESPGMFSNLGTLTPTPGTTGNTPGPSGYNWSLESLNEDETLELKQEEENELELQGEMLPPSLPSSISNNNINNNYFSNYSMIIDESPLISPLNTNSSQIDQNSISPATTSISTFNPTIAYNPFFPPPPPPFVSTSTSILDSTSNLDMLPSSSPEPESYLQESNFNRPNEIFEQQSEEIEESNLSTLQIKPLIDSNMNEMEVMSDNFETVGTELKEEDIPLQQETFSDTFNFIQDFNQPILPQSLTSLEREGEQGIQELSSDENNMIQELIGDEAVVDSNVRNLDNSGFIENSIVE